MGVLSNLKLFILLHTKHCMLITNGQDVAKEDVVVFVILQSNCCSRVIQARYLL